MDKSMEKKLIDSIGEKRYLHCLRVMETATLLAEIYELDIQKVQTAAILHDCGKLKNGTELLKKAYEFDIMIDTVMEYNPELLHASIGAEIANMEYGIKDTEVLNSIKYHTTGRENMTMLDKIIYIADYIEPSRNFAGVEEVRKLAFGNINSSMALALDNTIEFLIKDNKLIHLDTIKARNYFKQQTK